MTNPQNETNALPHPPAETERKSSHRTDADKELEALLIHPEPEETPEEPTDKKRKKPLALRIALIVLAVLLALVLIAGIVVVWMYYQGRSELLNDEIPTITPPDSLVEYDDDDRVIYNGVTYEYNQNVTAVLVVGVDKKSGIQEDSVYGQNGQADTLFLATLDTETGDIGIIPLSRETMVDVDQYAVDGTYLGVEKTQLCLAYSYASNGEEGCENVVRSASRLLYGIPINSYIALDMEGVKALTDAIGGVPLTALEDVYHPFTKEQVTKKGERITLNGKDALTYMRYRDTDATANNRRMKRLKQFFNAFIAKSGSALKKDIGLLPTYYDVAEPYTITDINLSKITYLVGCTLTGNSWKNPNYYSISGEAVAGEKHNEFYADPVSAYEAVLATFYTPVDTTAP